MIPREKIARLLNAYWGSRPGDWDGMVERGRQHYLSRADEILALVAGEELDPAVEWEAWLAAEHKKSTYSRLLRRMARRSSTLRQKALLLADEKFGDQARLQREVYRLRDRLRWAEGELHKVRVAEAVAHVKETHGEVLRRLGESE